MAKKPQIDHIESGGEFFRISSNDKQLLKKGAVIYFAFICCDCGLEHFVPVEEDNGDIVARAYRDDVATANNRRKK